MLRITCKRPLLKRSKLIIELGKINPKTYLELTKNNKFLNISTVKNISSASDSVSSRNKRNKNGYGSWKNNKVILFTGSSLLLLSSVSIFYPKFNRISLDSISQLSLYSTKSRTNPAEQNKQDNNQDNSMYDKNSITLLNEEEVDRILRSKEQSFWVNRQSGIIRYDVAQLPSNNPIEDNHVEQIITLSDNDSSKKSKSGKISKKSVEKDLTFFGIFDGHSGTFTSKKLSESLVQYVANELANNIKDDNELSLTSENLDTSLVKGFLSLDDDIIYSSFKKLLNNPTKENMINSLPAISGSCALLSVFNSIDQTLKVAVAGDSRALLGSVDPTTGNWTVDSLSIDQTGDNQDEVMRIKGEHPNEPNVIRNGRVLGSLQPSRAFGDYRYKFKSVDNKTLDDLPAHLKVYFRSEPRNFLTPPYVTAKPEITTTNINENTKFMVIGSDGLFELLSNEEIAGLVISWMNESVPGFKNEHNTLLKNGKLPKVKDISKHKESQRPAFRYKQDNRRSKRSTEPEYILKDKNVSTHLIRNALSAGGNPDYVSTLVSIPSPMSRRYRDDLTVTVVFFGDSVPEGIKTSATAETLIANTDATTPADSLKAKL
ncbi:hypothetical protein TBLA_0B01830 [Henningerozyma blattae CBS 6284]|uniref:PPM-type phosphatase domain-containing protein n=1 Tax=Henningerozyma blattae (strain ATCC 34711 / CBS 6284 / DSM 70876 / NBRC 10599 / NRRL Y-10934 / UCD 77-7) TaxID=1071380 RepID=I2GY25_HENB6|nr:hypothetical protein TBLA_0B01830 [Tetrapisispora blattae CBS 6284]CCH59027.1 hypothetical protein TBLA_0B01830 [Tetrapisispora blattae CBS 6284]